MPEARVVPLTGAAAGLAIADMSVLTFSTRTTFNSIKIVKDFRVVCYMGCENGREGALLVKSSRIITITVDLVCCEAALAPCAPEGEGDAK